MREIFTHCDCQFHGNAAKLRGIAVAVTELEMEIQLKMRKRTAFTIVELLIVIAGFVLIAAMLLPALAAAKKKYARIGCINNLKQDALAFKMWANDEYGNYPMQVSVTNGGAMELAEKGIAFPIFQVMSNELNAPIILICSEDRKHDRADNFFNFGNSNISYFVNLDAKDNSQNSVLIGDDNFAVNDKAVSSGILNLTSTTAIEWTTERRGRFHGWGNVAFTDGSAEEMNNNDLHKFVETNVTLSRLVIP